MDDDWWENNKKWHAAFKAGLTGILAQTPQASEAANVR